MCPKLFLQEADPHPMKTAKDKPVDPSLVEIRWLMMLEASPQCQPVRQLSTRQSGFCGPPPHVAFKTRPPNVSGSWYLFLPSPWCTSSPSSIKFCLPKSIAGAIHISVTLLPLNLEEPRDSGRPAPWFAQTAADGGLT